VGLADGVLYVPLLHGFVGRVDPRPHHEQRGYGDATYEVRYVDGGPR
jgi:hypothetical protein